MRRILAVLILLTIAAFWAACGSDKTNAPNTTNANATGTTTYPNVAPSTTTAAPSGGGTSNSSSNTGAPPRIKPPTDK